MKLLRRLHLYLGVFFAPLLILFTVTGWWQTVSPNRNKGLGFGQSWIEKLSTIHIDQYYPLSGPHTYATHAFKWLVVAMSIGLLLSLLLGLILAFKGSPRKKSVIAALLAGILVPIVLLWIGEKARPHRLPSPALQPLSAVEAEPAR
ncbi:hypothetical protein SAMN05444156_3045 [Verrucomicrobium sp. GAS474]|uniref:hypothetical protein n=1 Tax=Verrucomicrobium sp. GAS474 TaxID=1882831 RepID=UPI000879D1F9|nr:hypothetical protein [Verrucomicrobium sp. GAS474]SDU28222.1 hypothetical protein SAMN05444156_3045 [Verrucomicrobium sp. GAS474]